jgi:anti-sigma B factor antagonist
MEIQVRKHANHNVQVISMHGNLMVGDAVDTLRRTITQTLGSGNSRIVFDMSDVKMLDSSGIGVLVRTLTAVKQRGGNAKLVNPSEFALQSLQRVGLVELFQIYHDEETATDSFATRSS